MDKRSEPKVFTKLRNHLVKTGEYEKFIKTCSMKNRSLKERFSEIWDREDLRNIINLVQPKNHYDRKDDELAKGFISNGLRFSNTKKYENALLALNFAILSAKNPKTESYTEPDKGDMKPLLVAYDMRSELLYKMCKYQECIRDIDQVFELGCPSQKVCFLQQRKVNCLLQLKKNKEAEKNVKILLEKGNSSENQAYIAELQELLRKCKIKKTGTQEDSKEELPRKIDIFERGLEYPLFIKKYKKDKEINVVSESIKIHYSPQKGRHLIASRDIEPGEILLAERSFSAVLLSKDKLRSFCCVCLRRVVIVLPCNSCSLVCYCSEECKASKRNIHPVECPVIASLLETNVDEEVAVAFRTLLKFNIQDILSEVLKAEKESGASEAAIKNARLFFNSPMSYSALTKLEGHADKRSGESILESVANAVLVVKLLQKIPNFWESKNQCEASIDKIIEILGGEVMKLLLNFQCNIHCIKELCIDMNKNLLDINCSDVGHGIYKKFSMMNHSCSPNSLNSNWGDVKYLYAISFIPKGEEILDSYGERHVSHNLAIRKNNLKQVYYFECECEACLNDWPLFEKLSMACKWICPVCKEVINQTTFQCGKCPKGSSGNPLTNKELNTNEIYDGQTLKKAVKRALENYKIVFNDMNAYKPSLENIKKISVYLSLLSKYTIKPNMPLIEAQETMMRAYDLLGSFSYKNLNFLK